MRELISRLMEIEENGIQIFYRYSGHVKEFSVMIYKDGWANDKTPDYCKSWYINKTKIVDIIAEIDKATSEYFECSKCKTNIKIGANVNYCSSCGEKIVLNHSC